MPGHNVFHDSLLISGGQINGPVANHMSGPVHQTFHADPDVPGVPGEQLTVGVIVALDEEFRHYQNVFGRGASVSRGRDGAANHVKRYEWPDARPITMVSRVIGRPGPEHASVAADQLIADVSPDFLVSIGISGRLSTDINLGDLVIGDTVTGYLANSKITDGASDGQFDVLVAGDSYRADKWLCDRAAGLETEAPELYREWRNQAAAIRKQSFPPSDTWLIQVARGPLAAGPVVVASHLFRQWLLRHKRDYLAVDMESGGAALAVWGNALQNVRLLVIRGISDSAGRDKAQPHQESDLRLRGAVMTCAARYLEAVLHHVASF